MAARAVAKVISSRKVMEGGGFEVRRPFGGGSHIDPFVMVRRLDPRCGKMASFSRTPQIRN